ncbi:MAG TPA: ABC transporter ATP-binding protein [Jiangellales bacterium]|nr:ABC transporter ATP-binding protein [Jiangellales bacterium]
MAEPALEQSERTGLVVTPEPPPAVRVRRVSQVYEDDRPPVLDRIDLDIAEGEFVCLLGASGCGKSTLLSLIAGLDRPTAGAVEVSSSRPALMFQEPALLPWLTAGGNVELALRARGVRRAERRSEVRRLLALVNLDGQAGTRVHELSGGMRQRVALARALAQDSRVLLMDEPFAALDAITRDVLHEELARLWADQGLTVVFVTHNVREAVRLGQRVVLMSSRPGRLVREWEVGLTQPRAIESPGVSALSTEITAVLRQEISRHAR